LELVARNGQVRGGGLDSHGGEESGQERPRHEPVQLCPRKFHYLSIKSLMDFPADNVFSKGRKQDFLAN
jgi:hypothetical protein